KPKRYRKHVKHRRITRCLRPSRTSQATSSRTCFGLADFCLELTSKCPAPVNSASERIWRLIRFGRKLLSSRRDPILFLPGTRRTLPSRKQCGKQNSGSQDQIGIFADDSHDFVDSAVTFRSHCFSVCAFEATLIVGNEETGVRYQSWI